MVFHFLEIMFSETQQSRVIESRVLADVVVNAGMERVEIAAPFEQQDSFTRQRQLRRRQRPAPAPVPMIMVS